MAAIQTYQRITIPTHWVAFAISLALHALLLWGGGQLPIQRMLPFDDTKEGRPGGSIALRLAPAPAPKPTPPPAPESRPEPAPSPKAPAVKAAPKPAPKPPGAPEILALERQAAPATPVAPAPAPARATAPANDFAAFVEARRRRRESEDSRSEPPSPPPAQQPVESDQAREERIRAANLGLDRDGAGSTRERGGGIFQIARVSNDEAEFFFYGWNKAIQRNSRQMIAVSRGGHATIELAVVGKMIELIRERSSGDFVFESKRLGRDVSLSARPADRAKLEEFLMREFFAVRAGAR